MSAYKKKKKAAFKNATNIYLKKSLKKVYKCKYKTYAKY